MKEVKNMPEIGEYQKIPLGDKLVDAVVKNVFEIPFKGKRAFLVVYEVEGYGDTQDYLQLPDDFHEDGKERIKRSMMPSEYIGKTPRDVDWTLYSENTDTQKKIANAFVMDFEKFDESGKGLYIFSPVRQGSSPSDRR